MQREDFFYGDITAVPLRDMAVDGISQIRMGYPTWLVQSGEQMQPHDATVEAMRVHVSMNAVLYCTERGDSRQVRVHDIPKAPVTYNGNKQRRAISNQITSWPKGQPWG